MSKINCFISYSHDERNKQKFEKIKNLLEKSKICINLSERKDKSNFTVQTIWDYLYNRIRHSSCTILLLTHDLIYDNKHKIAYKRNNFLDSGWVYNEISASLRNWKDNRINGIVCVVEDNLWPNINDRNLPEILIKNKNYIIWVKYSDFLSSHDYYINKAIENRNKKISDDSAFQIEYDLHSNK